MRLVDLFERDVTTEAGFQAWFSGSKAVDKNGKPLKLYHGTNADFDQFSADLIGARWGVDSWGYFFTPDYHEASGYASKDGRDDDGINVMPVYLSIKNPLGWAELLWYYGEDREYDDDEVTDYANSQIDGRSMVGYFETSHKQAEWMEFLKDGKHDGIILTDPKEPYNGIYIALEPTQIKSVFNKGEWKQGDPRLSEGVEDSPAFKQWFGNSVVRDYDGNPRVVYHGTDGDVESFRGMVWGSAETHVSNAYAANSEYRRNGHATTIPMYMRIERPYIAHWNDPSTIAEWGSDVLTQAANFGEINHDISMFVSHKLDELQRCARKEESGPHYSRHDFWYTTYMHFGREGEKIIQQIYQALRFDGIIDKELDSVTYGVFDSRQAKSAFNKGEWKQGDPRISEQHLPEETIAETPDMARYIQHGLKLPKNSKLWRGVSEHSGSGMASYGMGLYMTPSRTIAKRYGTPTEMPMYMTPDQPVRFNTYNDFQMWEQLAMKALGFDDRRVAVKAYPDVSMLVRQFHPQADGLQVGQPSEATIVAWPVDE